MMVEREMSLSRGKKVCWCKCGRVGWRFRENRLTLIGEPGSDGVGELDCAKKGKLLFDDSVVES